MERRVCKRCILAAEIPEDVAVYLEKFLNLIPDGERTEDKIYQKRIDICTDCPKRTEALCMACGCYVELRAAVAEQTCPYGKWGRGKEK